MWAPVYGNHGVRDHPDDVPDASYRRTRDLLLRNISLQHASDRLRLESSLAGERMLATVGQDIHDGPVQLLTLLILRMGGRPNLESQHANVVLAQQALEELRAVSSGLALPELATAGLDEALETAVARHENLTGTRVIRAIATFHPAYLLRSPSYKRLAWQDLRAIAKALAEVPAS